MTVVVPDSKLKILKGIPINNSYKDTLYFASKTAQYNYFSGQATQALTFDDYTYIRVTNNRIRVGVGADDVYDANYLMFQNTAFGTKWFYAFITNVEYINNACTEITFEIDRIQTWWFDVTLRSCMISRQHDPVDTLYANCEPEPFDVEATITHYDSAFLDTAGDSFSYVTVTTGHISVDPQTGQRTFIESTGSVKDGLYSPLEILIWPNEATQIANMQTYLNLLINERGGDDILALFTAPSQIGRWTITTPAEGTASVSKSALMTGAFQGYVPKNNKMFNYPFFKLTLEHAETVKEFRVEDFRVGTSTTPVATNIEFKWYAIANPAPQLIVIPKNYQGMDLDYSNAMDISSYPQCPVKGDAYQLWLAQNSSGYAANMLGGLVNIGVSAAFGDPIGTYIGIRQTIQELANTAGQSMNYQNMPDKVNGLGKSFILQNIDKNIFWLHGKSLDYWKARQIDTYFTMFGYAQNHVDVPNIHARSKWTYVQTAGCSLVGNAPADDLAFIQSRFDSGITWWVNPSEVGRYDLTNSVLS